MLKAFITGLPKGLALLALSVALLTAAACGDNGDGNGDNGGDEPEPTAVEEATEETSADDESGSGASLLGALNPFELLDTTDASPGAADPDLAAALLDSGDLPGDYMSFGEFGMTVPSEFGDIPMAANMFFSGDMQSEDLSDFNGMVMSAAMTLPPDAVSDADLEELAGLSEEDLADLESEFEGFEEFGSFELLDASGLGDAGFGMHFDMDFAALFGAFGAPAEEDGPTGISADMYMFFQGDHAFMVMVMSPTGNDSGVDARDLAEELNANAQDAF
jgi:hypothetical protein